MKLRLVAITASLMALIACGTQKKTAGQNIPDPAHNSQNSLDWAGIYKGVSTDDERVITIELKDDGTYILSNMLVGSQNAVSVQKGTFQWNKEGSDVILTEAQSKTKATYWVGEGFIQLRQKDAETSAKNMRLNKIMPENITEKYWKLIELRGNPITSDMKFNREPHFILKNSDYKVIGSGGCNNFFGTYQQEGLRISFSKIGATLMACMDITDIESDFFSVLEQVDNYTISADGNFLSLNKGRMAPLARFEVVYLY